MFFFIFTAHRGAPRPLNTPLLYPSGLEIQLAQGRWTTDSFTEPRNDAIPFFHPFSIYIFGREALQHPHEALSVQPEPCSAPALTHSCSFFVKPLVKLSKRSLTESPAAYFNLFFFFFHYYPLFHHYPQIFWLRPWRFARQDFHFLTPPKQSVFTCMFVDIFIY